MCTWKYAFVIAHVHCALLEPLWLPREEAIAYCKGIKREVLRGTRRQGNRLGGPERGPRINGAFPDPGYPGWT